MALGPLETLNVILGHRAGISLYWSVGPADLCFVFVGSLFTKACFVNHGICLLLEQKDFPCSGSWCLGSCSPCDETFMMTFAH